jgi:hypothetical protein
MQAMAVLGSSTGIDLGQIGDLAGEGELGVVVGGGEGSVIGGGGEGDAGDGGEQERGDSCKSPSSPYPRHSSTSQHRFAAIAGGGEAGDVIATGGGGVSGGAELLGALRTEEPTDKGALEPVTAVLRRGVGGNGFELQAL